MTLKESALTGSPRHAGPALSKLLDELAGPIRAALGGEEPGSLRTFASCPCGCVDETTRMLVRDSKGSPRFVVLVSSPQWPDMVARGVESAARAREALGGDLEAAVLP